MNKTAKTAMITALTLCVVGMVLSTAGYFAGGKDFNDSSGHVYVSGGTDSARKNLEVMEKQQINAFTKLNVIFKVLTWISENQVMTAITWNIEWKKAVMKIH